MDIHKAALMVMVSDELPDLGCNGLCSLFSRMGAGISYQQMAAMNGGVEVDYPERGAWTEARLTMVTLLAYTDERDFR